MRASSKDFISAYMKIWTVDANDKEQQIGLVSEVDTDKKYAVIIMMKKGNGSKPKYKRFPIVMSGGIMENNMIFLRVQFRPKDEMVILENERRWREGPIEKPLEKSDGK